MYTRVEMADVQPIDIEVDAPAKPAAEPKAQSAEIKENKYRHYRTFSVTVTDSRSILSVIRARSDPNIVDKGGFVYAFSPEFAHAQLMQWISHDIEGYMYKLSTRDEDAEADLNTQNELVKTYLEKRMWKYAEEFGLVKLYAKDFK